VVKIQLLFKNAILLNELSTVQLSNTCTNVTQSQQLELTVERERGYIKKEGGRDYPAAEYIYEASNYGKLR
jgi:hypothetical protein